MKARFLNRMNILITSIIAMLGFISCNTGPQPEPKYGVPIEKYGVPMPEYGVEPTDFAMPDE